MAKGHMRPAKEAKKPKKDAAAKSKPSASSFTAPEPAVPRGKPKKA